MKGEYPNAISREGEARLDEILRILRPRLMSDLVGIKRWRYARQISGGLEELAEALVFAEYLKQQHLTAPKSARHTISTRMSVVGRQARDESEEDEVWQDVSEKVGSDDESEDAAYEEWTDRSGLNGHCQHDAYRAMALMTDDVWFMGLFDATGEMMRWAITAMATRREIPGAISRENPPRGIDMNDTMDVEKDARPVGTGQNMVTDMRELRAALETLDFKGSSLERDAAKKMEVMRTCVEKVENACYGLIVRGSERPKDWVPTAGEDGPRPEPVEGY